MEPQAPKRHRLRRILAILAMIVLAAWLGLRNDGLRTQLVNRALAAINPWPDTRLSAATTSGSVLHSLNLFDVTLVRDDGSMALRIDTVEASWSLLPLLRRDIRLGAIRGTGLTIAPRRAADGSLDLLVPFQGDGDPSKWTIGIAELHVTESRLVIEDTLGGTWSADHLALVMTDFSSGNLLHLRVDTLGTELHDPVTGLPGSLSARFELTDGLIRLDTLSLSTPRSSVFGSGMLRLGQDSPFPDSARGTLSMGPLALADLVGLYPSLNPEGILSGQVVLGGTEALWTAEADLVLSAGSPPPGSIIARATWQPDGEAFTGRVDATGVGPAHLLADQSRQDRFDAVVIADLVGSRADSLSGTSRLEVTRGSMGGFTLVGEIDQIWTAGTIALDGAGRSGATAATTAAAWTLGGTISPFGPEPTYNLRLNVPRLAMQSLAPDSQVDASVAVGLTVSGTGFSRDASVDARLLVTGGHLADCRVGPGEIVAILRAETVRITADLPACNGGLDAAGRLSMDGSWTIGSLNLMNVDGALALADASGSLVSARIHGEGSFAGAGRGTLEWTADSLRWGPNRLDALAGRLRYRGSVWGADAEARVDSGLVRLAADGTRNAARLTDLTVDRLDLSAVMGDPAYRTRLTGRGDGQFERANGADWTGSVDLAIAGSRIVEQEITSGSVRAVLGGGGRIDLVSGLEWPGGRADVKADLLPGQGEATPATIRITRFDFEGVDAGAFAGLTNLETRLAGSATGHVTLGSTGPETRLDVTFVPGTTINGVPVGQATVTASTGPDRIVASIKARLGGDSRGRLFADLNLVGMGTTPTYTMDVRLDSVDFGRLGGLDSVATSLTMRGHIDGSGFEPGSASFSFRVDSLVGRWRDLTVGDLVARGAWRAGLLQLDTLSTTGSFGHIEAHGGLPILRTADPAAGSANLTLAAALKDVGPIFEAAGIPGVHTAGGRIDLTVAGTAERLSANAAGSVDGLAWGDLHVATAKAVLSVETGTSMPRMQSALRVDASVLSTPRTTADALVLDARANGDSLTVSSTVDFSAGRRASFDVVTNTGLTRVLANRLDLDLDGTSWRLSTPATAEREGDGIRFSPVILDAGESRLVVSGLVSLHNPDFSVAATRVRLDAVADLLGYRGFGLVIDGSFVALGQDVGGTIEADVTSYGGPPVHLSLQTTYLDRKLSLDGLLRNEEGQTATIAGFLTIPEDRVAGQALPVELTVTADAFPIDWTRPFFDRELLDEVGGAITGTLTISGTFYDPDLGGSMRLERGRIGIVTLGRPGNSMKYTDITADLAFSGVTIQIITASLRSGPGRMNATGTIELTQLTFGAIDLQLRSQDFLAIDDEVYRAFVDADLHLSGTTRRPVLGGRVLVSRGDFRMSEESAADAFAPISLSTADLLTIERRFGLRVSEADTSTFVFYEALAIEDMRLEFDRDAWMRSSSNPKMDIQFTGNLDVRKSPHAEPTVYGDISVIPENSRIEQFGRRFNIERGNLTFTGPPTEPEIDLAGLYRVPSRGTGTDEVTIRLLATGRLDDLRVTFDSDPAMELADVISYIATGRPASGSLQFGGSTGTSYLSTAAGLAVGPISSLMEEFALAGLGLDVVEIENDGIRGLTLTVGKYVSPDFFVSVSQPIALSGSTESSNQGQDRSTQVTMEYEIVRQVLLSLLNRGSVLRINLRWEYAF